MMMMELLLTMKSNPPRSISIPQIYDGSSFLLVDIFLWGCRRSRSRGVTLTQQKRHRHGVNSLLRIKQHWHCLLPALPRLWLATWFWFPWPQSSHPSPSPPHPPSQSQITFHDDNHHIQPAIRSEETTKIIIAIAILTGRVVVISSVRKKLNLELKVWHQLTVQKLKKLKLLYV